MTVDHEDAPGQPNGRLAHEDAWTRWCPLCISKRIDEVIRPNTSDWWQPLNHEASVMTAEELRRIVAEAQRWP